MLDIVNPRQTVLVTCAAEITHFGKKTHKDNIIALDWHQPLSFKPMMYSISVSKLRYSYNLLHESKVFAVNFMSIDNEEEVLFCGRNRGEHIDKFEKTGLTKEDCEKIDCPRIKEALAFLECQVVEEVETGDHVLLIAKVLKSELKKQGKRIFHATDDSFLTTSNDQQ